MQGIKRGNSGGKGRDRLHGNSVHSAQFFYEPKTALKSSLFTQKKKKIKKATGLRGAKGLSFLGLPHSLYNLSSSKYFICTTLSHNHEPS